MITYYNPLGGVSLTNEYFAGLVGEAAQHCYGVAGMASSSASDSIKSLILGKNRADKACGCPRWTANLPLSCTSWWATA